MYPTKKKSWTGENWNTFITDCRQNIHDVFNSLPRTCEDVRCPEFDEDFVTLWLGKRLVVPLDRWRDVTHELSSSECRSTDGVQILCLLSFSFHRASHHGARSTYSTSVPFLIQTTQQGRLTGRFVEVLRTVDSRNILLGRIFSFWVMCFLELVLLNDRWWVGRE